MDEWLMRPENTWVIGLTLMFGLAFCVAVVAGTLLYHRSDPHTPQIKSWRGDFDDWMRDDITLQEFLDRRWAFRRMK